MASFSSLAPRTSISRLAPFLSPLLPFFPMHPTPPIRDWRSQESLRPAGPVVNLVPRSTACQHPISPFTSSKVWKSTAPATSSTASPGNANLRLAFFPLLIRQNRFRATSFLTASCKIPRLPPLTIRQFPNRCAVSPFASTLSYLVASLLHHFIASYLPLPLCTQAHSLFPGARQFNGKL